MSYDEPKKVTVTSGHISDIDESTSPQESETISRRTKPVLVKADDSLERYQNKALYDRLQGNVTRSVNTSNR